MAEISDVEVGRFIEEGFLRLDGAFPRELADECRAILWRDTGCDEGNPATWTKPVVRLNQYTQEPFRRAANTPRLHAAFDRLVGQGRWVPCGSLGTFPVRFPSPEDPGDAGWHIDAGFPGDNPGDFFSWRINVSSKGRALLMLFLFSDVGQDDAPTRIRVGSHLDIARLLEPEGDSGLTFMEVAGRLDSTVERPVAFASGEAGTVYLCHPFLVHAAQPHHGTRPRFMAQPPLLTRQAVQLHRDDGAYSPVERAIRLGLGRESPPRQGG
ncbi:phytanoyl-CoA dioxygenase family protein [Hyalangium gracile]|uniref:phytanoyl-CoA dioxygenase family protein n=1 Tax=Hyalangium gracile TaxID=394092 RepID=UPI001CC95060|nr:phytanoyl-CoA dioxygenase family protein [Hyalangium gracile]